jgi:hypothetical protein
MLDMEWLVLNFGVCFMSNKAVLARRGGVDDSIILFGKVGDDSPQIRI